MGAGALIPFFSDALFLQGTADVAPRLYHGTYQSTPDSTRSRNARQANAGIPQRGFFKRSEVPSSDVLLDVVRLAASRNEADLILSEYRSLCKGVVS